MQHSRHILIFIWIAGACLLWESCTSGSSPDISGPEAALDDRSDNSGGNGPDKPGGETVFDTGYVDVLFLGNDGVLVSDGENEVVVDGLHRAANSTFWSMLEPGDQVLLENAQLPYDSVDALLVTHNHTDHYSITPLGQHLNCNPQTRFLGEPGVRNALASLYPNYSTIAAQVVTDVNPLPFSRTSTTITGVEIEVLNMAHFFPATFPGLRNYAFIVHIGGLKLLHLGDVDMLNQDNIQAFNLAAEDIDVVFLPTPFSSFVTQQQRDVLMSWIAPQHIVALHIQNPDQAAIVAQLGIVYPQATVLTEPLTMLRFEAVDFQ